MSKGVKSTERRGGFTLIELLVVVAVIALLLAILLPALRKTRMLAARIRCGSNLRQIAFAWHHYLDDNDERFYQGVNANLNYGGWIGKKNWSPRPLNIYFDLPATLETEEDAEVFFCPVDRGGVPGPSLREKAFHLLGTSYQTNIFLIGQNACGAFSSKTAVLDAEISDRLPDMTHLRACNPSLLLLIGDYGWINQWKPRPHPQQEFKDLAEWHGRKDCHNMVFLDCHVNFLNIQKGFYITDEYTILPFKDLYGLAYKVQGPEEP